MGNHYGIELREKAVSFVLGGGSQTEAARVFGVDRTTIYRWLKRAESDSLEPIIVRDYVSNKLSLLELKHYVDMHREDTILEMSRHFGVSYGAIWYKLKKLGYVIKKTMLYKERNEERRLEFKNKFQKIAQETLVYLDESGIDENAVKEYAWVKKGQTVIGERVGKYKHRTTIIAALNQGEIIAPFYFKGYTDSFVFITWLQNVFCQSLFQAKQLYWITLLSIKCLRSSR